MHRDNWLKARFCAILEPHTNSAKICFLSQSLRSSVQACGCDVTVSCADSNKETRSLPNYCTALKRNKGRSAHGNLVHWVNLQNRIRAGSSYSHCSYCIISPAVAGSGSRSCTDNTSNRPVLYQILQFFDSPVFSAARSGNKYMYIYMYICMPCRTIDSPVRGMCRCLWQARGLCVTVCPCVTTPRWFSCLPTQEPGAA